MFSTKKFTELAVLGPIDGTEIFAGVSQGGVSSQVELNNLFGPTNFDFSSGFIDTIQDIDTNAFPNFNSLTLNGVLLFDKSIAGAAPQISTIFTQIPTSLPFGVFNIICNGLNANSDPVETSQWLSFVSDDTPGSSSGGMAFNIQENNILACYQTFDGSSQRVLQERRLENLSGYQSFSEQIVVNTSQNITQDLIGRTVLVDSASNVVLSIPQGSNFPINTEFDVIRIGTGNVGISAEPGVSINGVDSAFVDILDQWDRVRIRLISGDDYTSIQYSQSSGGGVPTLQEVYDASSTGNIVVDSGKPLVTESTNNLVIPEMITDISVLTATAQLIGSTINRANNTAAESIDYFKIETNIVDNTDGNETSKVDFFGYRSGGTQTLFMTLDGLNDQVLINRNVLLNSRNLSGVNFFTQNLGSSIFNDAQGNGSFTVRTPLQSEAFKLNYTGESANFNVPLSVSGSPVATEADLLALDRQTIYNQSSNGEIALSTGKPVGYSSTDTGVYDPSMSSAQFASISSPVNGLRAWSNDLDRPIYNTGTPGSPTQELGAYLSDIAAVQEDTVYGETYIDTTLAPIDTTIVTPNTPVQIAGNFVAGSNSDFTTDANGEITYIASDTRTVEIVATISGTLNLSNDDIEVSCFLDKGAGYSKLLNTIDIISLDGVSPSFRKTLVSGLVTLDTGDKIHLRWSRINTTGTITAKTCNFRLNSIGGVDAGASSIDLQGAFDNSSPNGTIQTIPGKSLRFLDDNGNVMFNLTDNDIVLNPNFNEGRFFVNTQNTVSALQIDYVSDFININTQVFRYKNRGVNTTFFTLENGQADFSPGYKPVWQSFNGTNLVVANTFEISHQIEITLSGILFVNFTGPNVDDGSKFRFSFGNLYTVESQDISSSSFISTHTSTFELKITMTRTTSNIIEFSSYGSFIDGNNSIQPIQFIMSSIGTYNENVTEALLLEYDNGNSPGNTFAFQVDNMRISQYIP